MAISNSDGSIILSTMVDTSGIKRGFSSVQNDASSLTKSFRKLTSAIVAAFSVQKIIQFSKESSDLATETEASVQRLIDIYGSASQAVGDFIDANSRALGISKTAAASYASVYGNLFSVWADQETNARLTNKYLQATAVVASKTGRTVEDVQERIRSGLLGNTEAIEDLGIFVNVKTIEMTDAFKRMANGKSWERLDAYTQQQIRSFAILEQATAKYGIEVAKTTALTKSRFRAAFEDFQKTWGQVVNKILVPVLEVLTKIFSVATSALNEFLGQSGETVGNYEDINNTTGETVDNQKDLTDEIIETNKALKKSIASFDDLEILTSEILDETSESMDNITKIEIPGLEDNIGIGSIDSEFDPDSVWGKIKAAVEDFLPLVELALVAIGLLLMSMGQFGWGLGFIIGGAYLYSVDERSEGSFDFGVMKEDLAVVVDYIEEALVAIGLLLLFFGQLPMGISFILTGAYIYIKKEITEAEESGIQLTIKEKLEFIMGEISLALAAVGIILLFLGHFGLGVGFLYVGAKAFEANEEKIEEGSITGKIQKFLLDNRETIEGFAWAAIIIGITLMIFGVWNEISLGLLASGAAVLITEEVAAGEDVSQKIKDFFNEHRKEIKTIGYVTIVLGIILLLGMVSMPLGLGLIFAGVTAVKLADEKEWKPEEFVSKLKRTIQEILIIVSAAALVIGFILLFVPGGQGFGIGLILSAVAGLVTAYVLDPDGFIDILDDFWKKIMKWFIDNVMVIFTAAYWKRLGIEALNGLLSAVEDICNGIIDIFQGMINTVIDILNLIPNLFGWEGIEHVDFGDVDIPPALQEELEQTKKELADWKLDMYIAEGIAEGIETVQLKKAREPQIPYSVYADSKTPSYAKKTENQMDEEMRKYLESQGVVFGQTPSVEKNSGTTEVVLEVDGREFGRAVLEQFEAETKRVGTSLAVN